MNLISLYYVLCLILFCFVVDLCIYIYICMCVYALRMPLSMELYVINLLNILLAKKILFSAMNQDIQ